MVGKPGYNPLRTTYSYNHAKWVITMVITYLTRLLTMYPIAPLTMPMVSRVQPTKLLIIMVR